MIWKAKRVDRIDLRNWDTSHGQVRVLECGWSILTADGLNYE